MSGCELPLECGREASRGRLGCEAPRNGVRKLPLVCREVICHWNVAGKLLEILSLLGEDLPLLPDGLHVEASNTSHTLGYLLLDNNLDLLQNSVMFY